MFSIYKALTAVKLAEQAASGNRCCSRFLARDFDHDLAEVNHISISWRGRSLHTFTTSSHGLEGAPVSDVRLGERFPLMEEAATLLEDSEACNFCATPIGPAKPWAALSPGFMRKVIWLMGRDSSRCFRSGTSSGCCARLSCGHRAGRRNRCGIVNRGRRLESRRIFSASEGYGIISFVFGSATAPALRLSQRWLDR